jgi:hypothetical protein
MTLQGTPAATTPAGISLVTTLPAPITEPSPIVTPEHIVELAPIHTLSDIVIGAEVPIPLLLCSGLMACPEHAMHTPGAMNVPFSILTGEVSRITQL